MELILSRRAFLGAAISLCAAPSLARRRRGWPGGMVSFTYDDGLDSQLDIAAPQLEAAGLQGTFYLTWDNIRGRLSDWRALAARGHELANHTVTHDCDLAGDRTGAFRRREIDPMERWLRSIDSDSRGQDYAYPCDVTDLGPGSANAQAERYSAMLRRAGIDSARTSEGPPNPDWWVRRQPYRLQALALGFDTRDAKDAIDYLSRAARDRRWAILVTHAIGEGRRRDGVISADEHREIVAAVGRLGLTGGTVRRAIALA